MADLGQVVAALVESHRGTLEALEGVQRALAQKAGPEAQRVSQATSLDVLGIPRGLFLELAREYRAAGGDVLAVGKLRLVERAAFEAWLRSRGTKPTPTSNLTDLEAELGLVERR